MAEPVRIGRSDAQINKAKMKLKQIAAQAKSQRIKQMMNRPQPRVKKPSDDQ